MKERIKERIRRLGESAHIQTNEVAGDAGFMNLTNMLLMNVANVGH